MARWAATVSRRRRRRCSRAAFSGQNLQQATTAPRWLLGRTWGQASATLKIESRFDYAASAELSHRGHDVSVARL
jgi:gamma-glutamyltranspeptidase/glutathione hydrolase